MPRSGLVLDIEGSDIALVSCDGLTAEWASVRKNVIMRVPTGMVVSVDPDTLIADAGGQTLQCTDLSFLQNAYDRGDTATLTKDTEHDELTFYLDDTASFLTGGYAWIGRECIQVDAKTATTISCNSMASRGKLGTVAQLHPIGAKVYTKNPTILHRRCWLRWQEIVAARDITNDRITRFTGFIDSIEFIDGRFDISILSPKHYMTERRALSAPWSDGTLARTIGKQPEEVVIKLNSKDERYRFKDLSNAPSGSVSVSHLQIDNEIIAHEGIVYPSESTEIISTPTGDTLVVAVSGIFGPGDTLDIEDASGNIKIEGLQAVKVDQLTNTVTHNAVGYTHAGGDKLVHAYQVKILRGRLRRASVGTVSAVHEAGTEVKEVRLLQGDQVDLLFQMLFSVRGHQANGPDSGKHDVLPEEWGFALPQDLVDVAAFDKLRQRSGLRLYIQKEGLSIADYLQWLAWSCNAYVFWQPDGKLSCRLREDLYPGTGVDHTIGTDRLLDLRTPAIHAKGDMIRNAWSWRMDKGPDGEFQTTLRGVIAESIRLYGQRDLEPLKDPGVRSSATRPQWQAVVFAVLFQRSEPVPIVRCDVVLDPTSTEYMIGDRVVLDFKWGPNQRGTEGLDSTDTWELIGVEPSDMEGRAHLTLIHAGPALDTAHIAPSGLVQSVTGSQLRLEPASVSHFAPSIPEFEPPSGRPGTEDSDWFLVGDPITLWDESTLGSASPVSANANITTIDYAARLITLDVIPGWLAAGDTITLASWNTVKAGPTAAQRENTYMALADGSTTPPLLGGSDPAFVWGS